MSRSYVDLAELRRRIEDAARELANEAGLEGPLRVDVSVSAHQVGRPRTVAIAVVEAPGGTVAPPDRAN